MRQSKRHFLVSLCLASSVVLAFGCSSSSNTGTDGGGTDVPVQTGGATYTYVASTLAVPTPNAGMVEGFNHDGTADAVCGKSDYTSPWGETGVDNGFAGGIGSLRSIAQVAEFLDGFQTSINTGSVLLILTVSNVNDLTNDSSVTVSAVYGYVGATRPTLTGDRLAPDQVFPIDSTSVNNGDPTMAKVVFTNARIVNGILEAGPSSFTLTLPVESGPVGINLRAAKFRARITADTLTEGALGGLANVSEVSAGIAGALPEQFRALLPTILAGLADADPPAGTNENCASLSLAVAVAGVKARLGAVVTRPAPVPADGGVPVDSSTTSAVDAGVRDATTGG